mgnify:CR=1 FL=1
MTDENTPEPSTDEEVRPGEGSLAEGIRVIAEFVHNRFGFHPAFAVAAFGMVISVIIQVIFHRKYVTDPDHNVLGLVPEHSPKASLSAVNTVGGLALFSVLSIALIYADVK